MATRRKTPTVPEQETDDTIGAEERPDIPRWLTPKQVADALQFSARSIRRLIARGELPASHVGPGGKILRVNPIDLDTYMATHRTPTTAVAH